MKLYGLSTLIVRILATGEQEEAYGPPPEFDTALELDADTNAEIATGVIQNYNAYTLISGILYYNGQPVTINPPGRHFLDRATIKEFWNDLGNGIDWLEAHRQTWQSSSDAWDGLTNAQKQTQLLDNFGVLLGDFSMLLYINYRVLIFIRWLIKALKLLVSL